MALETIIKLGRSDPFLQMVVMGAKKVLFNAHTRGCFKTQHVLVLEEKVPLRVDQGRLYRLLNVLPVVGAQSYDQGK